ncbi:hypothetical protein EON64_19305 [archaeon]|nr:MAG: hypothetical protein EON64_19305 [archaeon]
MYTTRIHITILSALPPPFLLGLRLQASSGLAIVDASVPLDSTGYTDANTFYTAASTSLSTSVTTGVFTTYLNTVSMVYGATDMLNADATDVEVSDYTVEDEPQGGGDDDELSDGAVAGIVIGTIVGFAFVCAAVYYVLFFFVTEGSSSVGVASAGTSGSRRTTRDVEIAL